MKYPHDHLLGKSGQHAAMAEFLARGFNIAIPDVDTGDDFLVLDERTGEFSRIQVKTSSTTPLKTEWGFQTQFWVRTRQLETPKKPELYYVLAARHRRNWEYLIVARRTLLREHRHRRFGTLAGEQILLSMTIRKDRVTGNGRDMQPFRNNFERYWEPMRKAKVA